MANTLEVSLALKSAGFRQEINNIKKDNQVLKAEFEKLSSEVDDFENTLEGKQARLKLVSKEYENAQKIVDVYKRQLEESRKTVEDANKKFNDQKEAIASTKAQIQDYTAAFGANSDVVNALRDSLDALEKEHDDQAKKVASANSAYQDMQIKLAKAETSVNKLGSELKQCSSDVDNFDSNLSEIEDSLKDVESGLDETGESLSGFAADMSEIGENLMEVGEKLTDIGQTIAGALSAALEKSNEVEGSLNHLQASLGLTNEDAEEFKEIINGVYANNFGEDMNEVAGAVSEVHKRLGITGEELQTVTEYAFGLSDTFGYDVSESARAASMLMNKFGISGEEAYNLITQGAQSGIDYSQEMLDSISEYSVYFADAGLSAEDMFNIFYSGADEGAFQLDKVVDAMKELSIRMLEGGDDAAEALSGMGLNSKELFKQFAKGGDDAKKAFQKIMEALGKVKDPIKQNQYGVALMGTQFEDLGVDAALALGDIGDNFNKVQDSAEALNEVKYDTVTEALQGIGRAIDVNIFAEIGKAINDMLKPLIPIIENVVNSISEWVKANPGLVKTLSTVAAVIAGVLIVLGTLFTTIGIGIAAFYGLQAAVAALTPIFAPVLAVVGAVIAAIVILAGSIAANWEGIKQATSNLVEFCKPYFDQLKESFSLLWTTCQDIYNTIIAPLFTIIGQVIEECINFVSPILGLLMTHFSIIFNAISLVWNTIGKPVFSAIMAIIEVVWSVVQPILSNISSLFGTIVNAISSAWTSIGKPVFDGIISIAKKIATDVGPHFDTFKKAVKGAMDFVLSPINLVIDAFESLFGWISDTSKKVGDFLNKINPFGKGKSIDIGLNGDISNLPGVDPLQDIALSGSYYNRNTPLNESLKDMVSNINSIPLNSSSIKDLSPGNATDTTRLEGLMENMIRLLSIQNNLIRDNGNQSIELDGRTVARAIAPYSNEINKYNARNPLYSY